jgi:tol-pal system protein YbgF
VEVDKRLQTVEQDKPKPLEITKIVPSTTDVPKPAPGAPPASEPRKVLTNESIAKMDPISLYNDAFGKFQKGKLDDAERGFKEFLDLYPVHENADNAMYWQGEVKYARGQFQDALQLFNRVIEQYPKGNKVPDALVKIGYCHLRVNEIEQAKSSFKRVIEEHPFSFAANQAQRKLEELK